MSEQTTGKDIVNQQNSDAFASTGLGMVGLGVGITSIDYSKLQPEKKPAEPKTESGAKSVQDKVKEVEDDLLKQCSRAK
jgi:hypothetical protein